MKLIRIIIISSFVFIASSPFLQNTAYGQESDDVKNEIKELKQMMEKMQ